LGGLGGVPAGTRLIGHDQRLPGAGLQLLHLGELAAEPHLELTLITDDLSGLVGQRLVLPLRVLDGLLDLHLRIGLLVDLGAEQCQQVFPALAEWVCHMVIPVFLVENLRRPRRSGPAPPRGVDRTGGRARGSSHGWVGQAAHTPTLRRSITRASIPSTGSKAFSPAATIASGLTAAAIPSPMAMAEPTSNSSSETGTSSARQIAASSSLEASLRPRSTSDR